VRWGLAGHQLRRTRHVVPRNRLGHGERVVGRKLREHGWFERQQLRLQYELERRLRELERLSLEQQLGEQRFEWLVERVFQRLGRR
jgi:hypothetical protein